MKRISASGRIWRPINRTAGLVTARGSDTPPQIKKLNEVCSPFPLATQPSDPQINLTGTRIGWLTVIGRYGGNKSKARWVCRCNCGNYTLRSRRAILNLENRGDRCVICRNLAYLKRAQIFREYGKDVDVRDI